MHLATCNKLYEAVACCEGILPQQKAALLRGAAIISLSISSTFSLRSRSFGQQLLQKISSLFSQFLLPHTSRIQVHFAQAEVRLLVQILQLAHVNTENLFPIQFFLKELGR